MICIEDGPLYTLTDRHRDRPLASRSLTPRTAAGRLSESGAHQVVAEVLRHLRQVFAEDSKVIQRGSALLCSGMETGEEIPDVDGPVRAYAAMSELPGFRRSVFFGSGSRILRASPSWG